ncbi:MAG: transporter substrate-binding domain-containing protein [Herbaspirillum sp.]
MNILKITPALALFLVTTTVAAPANDAFSTARNRGQLVVGLQTVSPPYLAGAKFRTPDGLDTVVANQIAEQLQLKLVTRQIGTDAEVSAQSPVGTDLQLVTLPDDVRAPRSSTVIPTGYSSGTMAIMRTDTTIRNWTDLKGKVVCVVNAGRHSGIAASYGAIEQSYRAPADSLLAMRTGECDAAIQDSALLEQLIKLPEWKKFSSRLPIIKRSSLKMVIPATDTASAKELKRLVAVWRGQHMLSRASTQAIRNMAFEVYLDQSVPDCH